jgi:hypothetical protein
MSVALDGTDVQMAFAFVGNANFVSYAIGTTHLYFIANGAEPKTCRTRRRPHRESAADPNVAFEALALGDDGYVYAWEQQLCRHSHRLWDAQVVAAITNLATPASLVLDGGRLYFTAVDGVYRVRTDGTNPMAIGPPVGTFGRIAIDSTTVRWAT